MIKQQLIQVRDLLKLKKYEEARAILQQIDHPMATQWLERLDQLVPVRHPPQTTAPETPPAQPAPTPPASGAVGEVASADADEVKAQLFAARDLIVKKLYDEAHALLAKIDHPTARDWLDKLTLIITRDVPSSPAESVAETTPPLPAPAPTPAEPGLSHDAILRKAQEALLKDQYDEARALLEPLKTPEAAFWLEKTGMTRFRTYENIWLDMFRYTLPAGAARDPASWRCPTCQRSADQALACPQRDNNPCPVKISVRSIEEPRRLALLLQAIHLEQVQDTEKMLGFINVDLLKRWQTELGEQVQQLGSVDVRRPAIERAIVLLGQQLEKRPALAAADAVAAAEKPAIESPKPPPTASATPPSETRVAAGPTDPAQPKTGLLGRIKDFFIN